MNVLTTPDRYLLPADYIFAEPINFCCVFALVKQQCVLHQTGICLLHFTFSLNTVTSSQGIFCCVQTFDTKGYIHSSGNKLHQTGTFFLLITFSTRTATISRRFLLCFYPWKSKVRTFFCSTLLQTGTCFLNVTFSPNTVISSK